ncbi:MAG TPA: YdcF family protein [Acidobacteriaceae bacterium]
MNAEPGAAAPPWTEPETPTRLRRRSRGWFSAIVAVVLLVSLAWVAYVYRQIEAYASHDEARPADAIAVFGAAEYDGRPSPVLRARLDHGLELYEEKLAPLLITLGGGDPTERHSEGGVGEDYLVAHGVPEKAIIAETRSSDTRESAERLAVIARANQLQRILVVSDGTHLFRIHALCTAEGLTVYTSPRRESKALSTKSTAERLLHEIVSYTAFRLHVH